MRETEAETNKAHRGSGTRKETRTRSLLPLPLGPKAPTRQQRIIDRGGRRACRAEGQGGTSNLISTPRYAIKCISRS